MEQGKLIKEVMGDAPNRRSFVRKMGLAGAAGAALLAGSKSTKAEPALSDTDILNFALNLEYLEAEFYTVATTGKTLEQLGFQLGGLGQPGPTTGGMKVPLAVETVYTLQVARELASDEQAHVLYLRSALGSAAVAKPAINLDALGTGFEGQGPFLTLARAFEDVGVSAYAGAAPLIQSSTYLQAAAQILGTEAEHSGNIRLQVAKLGIATTALDGVDVLPPPTGTKFFSTGANALVAVRTTGQVLYIVYGAANVTSGGFFPNGVNGTINMSSGPA
jgi:hypothetical protein